MDSTYKLAAVMGGIIGFAALLISVVALSASGDTPRVAAATEQPESAAAVVPLVIDVELSDLDISPSRIEVPNGGIVVARVTNTGAIPHDLVLETGEGTPLLAPGETAEYTFGPFSDSAVIICSVPGHAAAGMTMDVEVLGATASASGHSIADTSAGDQAVIDPNATPAADWEPRDPGLPQPRARAAQCTRSRSG